jgi:hypothetical protein
MLKTLQDRVSGLGALATGRVRFLEKGVRGVSMSGRQTDVMGTDDRMPTEEEQLLAERLMSKAETPEDRKLHEINDHLLLLGALLQRDPRKTRFFERQMKKEGQLRKSLFSNNASGSGSGQDWVPTVFSASFEEFFDLESKVLSVFPTIPMPSNPYKIPFESAMIETYLVPEAQSDEQAAAKVTESNFSTSNETLTAFKLGARSIVSDELTEDSIVPILPTIRRELARAIAKGREDAVINGDVSVTHQDADVTTSTNRKKAVRGLRFHGLNVANAKKDLSTFDEGGVRGLRALMDKWGVNPSDLVWIAGPKVYMKKILNLSSYTTMEKYGSAAVVLTGELGRLEGIPLIVSTNMRETLNASGVFAATSGTKATLILANRRAFRNGSRREMDMRLWEDPRFGQRSLTTTGRWAWSTPWTSDPCAVIGYNIEVVA